MRSRGSDVYDVAVVGAGILGLATSRELLLRHPALRLVIFDKEKQVATHQTGHNSGVLHAGLYYQPGSLKARLCRTGKALMEEYAEERGIAVTRCGNWSSRRIGKSSPRLIEVHRRGEANGVPDMQMLGPSACGMWSPMQRDCRPSGHRRRQSSTTWRWLEKWHRMCSGWERNCSSGLK